VEINELKAELRGKQAQTGVKKPGAVSVPSVNLKRKAASPPRPPALPESDGFVFVKKPKLTPASEESKTDLESLTAPKATPTRRDKFTRAERKQLPGYSTPDSEGFYRAFADTYDEQELKNKVSEHRYEYPPAKVPGSFYRLDI
jgi:hypothetical protein